MISFINFEFKVTVLIFLSPLVYFIFLFLKLFLLSRKSFHIFLKLFLIFLFLSQELLFPFDLTTVYFLRRNVLIPWNSGDDEIIFSENKFRSFNIRFLLKDSPVGVLLVERMAKQLGSQCSLLFCGYSCSYELESLL